MAHRLRLYARAGGVKCGRSCSAGLAESHELNGLTTPLPAAHDRETSEREAPATTLSLTTVGAACAIAGVAAFVVGIVFMAASGVQVLIPETGRDGLDWIQDVDDAGGPFFIGAWLGILGGLLFFVGLIGFYDALRGAGSWLLLAPILGSGGLILVTISHLIPIAMAYELVPGYTAADAATQASLATTADTLAALALVVNYTGDVVLWGVVVPMYAVAILKTSLLPRWIGWLAVGVGIFAGLGNALSPASSALEAVTFIGFIGFFVWNAAMGVALLRARHSPTGRSAAAPAA